MPSLATTHSFRLLLVLLAALSLCLYSACPRPGGGGDDDDDDSSGADDDDAGPDDDDAGPDDDDSAGGSPLEIELIVSIDPSLDTPPGAPLLLLGLFEEGSLTAEGVPQSEPVLIEEGVDYGGLFPSEVTIVAKLAGTYDVAAIFDAPDDGILCNEGDYIAGVTVDSTSTTPVEIVLDHVVAADDCGH